jgi:hypothetical protein
MSYRIIGFTGTRHGCTFAQLLGLGEVIEELKPKETHSGDCVGADLEFIKKIEEYELDNNHSVYTVSHPPINSSLRAEYRYNHQCQPRPYLDRNKDIVDSCDLLIACPHTKEEGAGGTWHTVRYARKQKKPIIIIYPDGAYVIDPLEDETSEVTKEQWQYLLKQTQTTKGKTT